ncbi:MAG: amidohydrolase family protein [Planctomycetes bacterium]|nr:amidohydrolase family protein [Planctomycetota bacterium]
MRAPARLPSCFFSPACVAIAAALCFLPGAASAAAAKVFPRYAILGGKVLTITQGVHEGGAILVSGGKIERVLADPPEGFRPEGYEAVDARGLWVLPGFVDLHSHIGGSDINDMVYPVNPGLRVLDNIIPNNPLLKRAQAGGVTTILFISGSGTNMSGFGALMKTGGDTLEEVLIRFPGALKIAQGGNPERRGGDLGRDRMGMNWLIRNALEEGKRYAEAWDAFEAGKAPVPPEKNPRLEYFRGLFRGEYPVVVHTQGYHLVLSTIRILHDELKLRVVIDHGEFDGSELGPEAAARGIMVMTGPRQFRFDNERGRFLGLAARWHEGGVKDVGVNTDAGVIPEEELFYQAAMAVRLGLDPEAALRGITIHGAKAMGIEGRVGSLEEGKDADIVLWTGDPFDVRSHVVQTLVNGKVVYDARREPRRF